MYIIELIVKLLKEKKEKPPFHAQKTEYEECEHIFLPVDSTGKILACSKCGFLINAADLKIKPKNPFET